MYTYPYYIRYLINLSTNTSASLVATPPTYQVATSPYPPDPPVGVSQYPPVHNVQTLPYHAQQVSLDEVNGQFDSIMNMLMSIQKEISSLYRRIIISILLLK